MDWCDSTSSPFTALVDGHASLLQRGSRLTTAALVSFRNAANATLNNTPATNAEPLVQTSNATRLTELLVQMDKALYTATGLSVRMQDATAVFVVISLLALLILMVSMLLLAFEPPDPGPSPAEEGSTSGKAQSPRKRLCPEHITPNGGQFLTLPEWVLSDPTWQDSCFEIAEFAASGQENPRLSVELQARSATEPSSGHGGSERLVLKEAFTSGILAFCDLPRGSPDGVAAPSSKPWRRSLEESDQGPSTLRIHRGDGQLFALLRPHQQDGFALFLAGGAAPPVSQKYRRCPGPGGRPAMRVTGDNDNVFVATAEGPFVKLGSKVDAGLVMLCLVSLRRLQISAHDQSVAARVSPPSEPRSPPKHHRDGPTERPSRVGDSPDAPNRVEEPASSES